MDRSADPVVRRFVESCLPALRRLYAPELVLAFGSRARGEAIEDSDLDLVIVSARFEGVPFLERPVNVLRDLNPPMAVDLLCYTPEEFARKREELGVVSEAVATGVPL